MPRLPNEILDEIWLERCKLGFEPRILQAKWINVGNMRLPAFYVAQPQAFITQLCHGAREVAAKGFYSRVFDNPSTGDGGFWWNEDDVLYIDADFYRELHPSRKAFVLGRDKITRVALDIQIDEDPTINVELIAHWFPNLSQVFFTGSARLFSHLEYGEEPVQCPRPEVSESALTKSFSITRFYPQCCPKDLIPRKIFVRVQGLTDKVECSFRDDEEMECFIETQWADLLFLIFDRDDARGALGPSVSPHKDGATRNADDQGLTLRDAETYLTSLYMTEIENQIVEYKERWEPDTASSDVPDDEYLHDWSDNETSHDASSDTDHWQFGWAGISPYHSGNSHPNDLNFHEKEFAKEEHDD